MFKLFTVVLSAFMAIPSFAASMACLEKIVHSGDFPRGMTDPEIECLANTDAGKMGLAQLCSANGENLSPMFKTYYLYKAAFKGALWRMTSATETAPEDVWLQEIRTKEKEWKQFGFYYEVNDLLRPMLHQANSTCRLRKSF